MPYEKEHISISMELDISAQRILNRFMLYNEQVEKQLEAGIKKAIENFDFEKVVEGKVKKVLQQCFLESASYNKIKASVDIKINEFIDANIDAIIDGLKVK